VRRPDRSSDLQRTWQLLFSDIDASDSSRQQRCAQARQQQRPAEHAKVSSVNDGATQI
jgi:hypothetical protein